MGGRRGSLDGAVRWLLRRPRERHEIHWVRVSVLWIHRQNSPPRMGTYRRRGIHETRGGLGGERKLKLTRARGGDPTDPANVLLGCRACHRWAHENDEAATALGLLVP